MATIAVSWLKIPRLGYFHDFGVITPDSTAQDALKAFTALNDILGFDVKVKGQNGARGSSFLG